MSLQRLVLATLALAAVSAPASALEFTMTFDGIPIAVAPPEPPPQGDGSAVLGFYNGDPVYNRNGNRNWNITFSDNALAICAQSLNQDCPGNFPTPPSVDSALGWGDGNSVTFTVSGGLYVSKLSFYYTDEGQSSAPAFRLFSGSTELLTQSLEPCPSGFCDWKFYEVQASDLAKGLVTSVAFLGTVNRVAFDSVSVITTPIPEPSTYALMLGGMALLAGIARRRVR